jgi:hypothetical protein
MRNAYVLTIIIACIYISCIQAQNNKTLISEQRAATLVNIPFYFGLSDYKFKNNGPTRVVVTNEKADTVFIHEGKWDHWGASTRKAVLKTTGIYFISVEFFADSADKKQLNEQFTIEGKEEKIDLTVSLEVYLQITVNKYYGNVLGLELKRAWYPQKQFTGADTTFLPEYDIVNTSDSTIYGIYHRFSSSNAISWVQLHDIAFLGYQQWKNGEWGYYIPCNAPRIQMNLKPGQTGNTLKDMKNDCGRSNFREGEKYRVVFEYGINNTIVREKELREDFLRYYYEEPHIYCIYDEFTLHK